MKKFLVTLIMTVENTFEVTASSESAAEKLACSETFSDHPRVKDLGIDIFNNVVGVHNTEEVN